MISFTEDEETIKPAKRFYNKLEDLMIGNPDRFEGLDENLTERIADPLDPAKWVESIGACIEWKTNRDGYVSDRRF